MTNILKNVLYQFEYKNNPILQLRLKILIITTNQIIALSNLKRKKNVIFQFMSDLKKH